MAKAFKYHYNPKTGMPGPCKATVRDCKFAQDGEVPPHYGSPSEARAAYEQAQAEKGEPLFVPISKEEKERLVEEKTRELKEQDEFEKAVHQAQEEQAGLSDGWGTIPEAIANNPLEGDVSGLDPVTAGLLGDNPKPAPTPEVEEFDEDRLIRSDDLFRDYLKKASDVDVELMDRNKEYQKIVDDFVEYGSASTTMNDGVLKNLEDLKFARADWERKEKTTLKLMKKISDMEKDRTVRESEISAAMILLNEAKKEKVAAAIKLDEKTVSVRSQLRGIDHFGNEKNPHFASYMEHIKERTKGFKYQIDDNVVKECVRLAEIKSADPYVRGAAFAEDHVPTFRALNQQTIEDAPYVNTGLNPKTGILKDQIEATRLNWEIEEEARVHEMREFNNKKYDEGYITRSDVTKNKLLAMQERSDFQKETIGLLTKSYVARARGIDMFGDENSEEFKKYYEAIKLDTANFAHEVTDERVDEAYYVARNEND